VHIQEELLRLAMEKKVFSCHKNSKLRGDERRSRGFLRELKNMADSTDMNLEKRLSG